MDLRLRLGAEANWRVATKVEYAITPFLAWLVAGCAKFIINSVKSGRLAFELIGYGGCPSNHSAIVSSTLAIIALTEGIDNPAFGAALSMAFIVMLDASSLRRQVGEQAKIINKLATKTPGHRSLRERIGHSKLEILAGAIVGIVAAKAVFMAIS